MDDQLNKYRGGISKQIEKLKDQIKNLGIYTIKQIQTMREQSGILHKEHDIRLNALTKLLIDANILKQDAVVEYTKKENENFEATVERNFDTENHLFIVEKPIEKGFWAQVDLTMIHEDKPQDFPFVMVKVGDDHTFPDSFHELLIGMKTGDSKEAEIDIPQGFFGMTTDMKLKVSVLIKKVKEMVIPPSNSIS